MSEHIERANDSFKKMNFLIEVDDIVQTGFISCDGLESDWSIIESRNGNDPNTKRKQRGIESFSDIALTGGVTTVSGELEEWHKKGDRRNISIIQQNHNQEEVGRWNVENAFPKTFKPFDGFDSESDEIQIESITLVHEGFKKV